MEEKVQADVDRGVLPSGTEANRLATYVMTVWQGLSMLARDGASRADLQAVVTIALQAWPPSQ